MKTQGTGAAQTASLERTGLVYKVGLGVIAVGVVFVASSWLLGDVAFASVTALLTLLGAPENRQLLPQDEPEAGGQLLQLFGGILFACGGCIVSLRLVVGLLGMAGNSEWTSRLGGADRLGSGAAAIGFLAIASTVLSQVVLYEVFLYEYGAGMAMSTLKWARYEGSVIFFGGLAILICHRRCENDPPSPEWN